MEKINSKNVLEKYYTIPLFKLILGKDKEDGKVVHFFTIIDYTKLDIKERKCLIEELSQVRDKLPEILDKEINKIKTSIKITKICDNILGDKNE